MIGLFINEPVNACDFNNEKPQYPDSLATIIVTANKSIFLCSDKFLNFTVEIKNNSEEVMFLPKNFWYFFQGRGQSERLRRPYILVCEVQKKSCGKFRKYTYPPDNVFIDDYNNLMDTTYSLQFAQTANFQGQLDLYESMPAANYRFRVSLNYPFQKKSSYVFSNWFYFKIVRKKTT